MSYFNIWEYGNMIGTGVGNSSIEMLMESDILGKYYGPSKGALVSGIRHNGGGFMDTKQAPEGTEVIAIFKNQAGTNSSSRRFYDQPSVWAYKASGQSGRLVVTGSHPEDAPSGDILNLTASMFRYAWDGVGLARVRDVLRNGDMIPVNPGIGDLQCHHFVLCPAEDAKNFSVSVEYSGDYDIRIYMKRDSFAFPDAEPEYNSGKAADGKSVLSVDKLEKGLWYVCVYCATTVDAKEVVTDPVKKKGRFFSYSGPTGVLNGVPYNITAEWKYSL